CPGLVPSAVTFGFRLRRIHLVACLFGSAQEGRDDRSFTSSGKSEDRLLIGFARRRVVPSAKLLTTTLLKRQCLLKRSGCPLRRALGSRFPSRFLHLFAHRRQQTLLLLFFQLLDTRFEIRDLTRLATNQCLIATLHRHHQR